MRRTVILSAVLAAFAVAAVSPALAQPAAPRGVLTQAEYQGMLAAQHAIAHAFGPHAGAQSAHRACKTLSGSRLMTTQRAECVASLIFFDNFTGFSSALARCEKGSANAAALPCLARVVGGFYTVSERFLKTDRASRRAALARGFSGRCFNFLVLTPHQLSAVRKIAGALFGFERALASLNLKALITEGKRTDSAISSGAKALVISPPLTACRHE